MQVTVGIRGGIVGDGNVDTFNIDTSTKDVSGDEDTLFKVLELLVSLDTLFLSKTTVDADGREVAFAKKLVELVGARDGLDEDDDLVEFERVEQVVELAVLGRLFKANVVLLETVEGELGLVIDVDFKGLQTL